MRKRNKIIPQEQSIRVPEEAHFVTPGVVAATLGFTQRGVIKMMERGALPGRKFGSRWLMHRDDFAKLTKPQLPDETQTAA